MGKDTNKELIALWALVLAVAVLSIVATNAILSNQGSQQQDPLRESVTRIIEQNPEAMDALLKLGYSRDEARNVIRISLQEELVGGIQDELVKCEEMRTYWVNRWLEAETGVKAP
jgi:hypothetical protein